MIWASDLTYQGCEISGVAADGRQFWSVVPEKNCVVSYSVSHKKFSMRIGSLDSTTFQHPVSISEYDNELYICNTESRKIRKINLNDYSVSDFRVLMNLFISIFVLAEKKLLFLNQVYMLYNLCAVLVVRHFQYFTVDSV